MPLASIILVTYGKRELTEQCLESLRDVLGDQLGSAFEIVVADNASPDDTLEMLAGWRDIVRVLPLGENRNFAGGCNAGAAAAGGDVLIFLNNDTIMQPGVLEELAATVRQPGVGAAGPRMLYPDGAVQHAGVIFGRDGAELTGDPASRLPYHPFAHRDGALPHTQSVCDLDIVTGACLVVDRVLFDELGGFDEGYVNGVEDVDLCLRIRTRGQRVVYRGDLSFVHDEGGTRGRGSNPHNWQRYHRTWGAVVDADHELARELWGADVDPIWPPRDGAPSPTGLTVVGEMLAVGPACDEARALVAGLEDAGAPVSAASPRASVERALLGPRVHAAVDTALRRALTQQLVPVWVPDGPAEQARLRPGSIARVPDARDVPPGVIALPATPSAAIWAAPAIAFEREPGAGGDGLLVTLPSHDPGATDLILDAIAGLGDLPVRLVPTTRTQHGLAERVAAVLPSAVLDVPCSSDDAWAALAAGADAAICFEPHDTWDRRALVAAGMGCAPLATTGDGPAAAVLGTVAVYRPGDDLSAAIAALDTSPGARAQRAALVREACAPAHAARRLVELLQGRSAAAA